MVVAVSYGDSNFSQSLDFNLFTARKYGKVDRVRKYTPEDIDFQFKEENKMILSARKGAGYWLWKPYVVNDALNSIGTGDYLVYADSGSFYMNNIQHLILLMDEYQVPVFLGEISQLEAKYSKRDATREGAIYREDKTKFNGFANEIFSINIVTTLISLGLLTFFVFAIPKPHLALCPPICSFLSRMVAPLIGRIRRSNRWTAIFQ